MTELQQYLDALDRIQSERIGILGRLLRKHGIEAGQETVHELFEMIQETARMTPFDVDWVMGKVAQIADTSDPGIALEGVKQAIDGIQGVWRQTGSRDAIRAIKGPHYI